MKHINNPHVVELKFQQALLLCQHGDFLQAKRVFKSLLKLLPEHPQLLTNLGRLELQLGNVSVGVSLLKQSIHADKKQPQALLYLANGLFQLKHYHEAEIKYKSAIEIHINYLEAYFNLGILYQATNKLTEALNVYDKALQLKADYAEAYNNRGNILKNMGRFNEALADFEQALKINAHYLDAYYNRANTLYSLRRYDEALIAYNHVLSINNNDVDAICNRGNTLAELGRLVEALDSFNYAIVIHPDFAEAYYNRANVLKDLNRHEDALVDITKALALKPDFDFLLGDQLHLMMHLCSWQNLEPLLEKLVKAVLNNQKVVMPFATLSLIDDLTIQRKIAEIYTQFKHSAQPTLASPPYIQHKKIRIAYFSGDFHNHATMHLMADIFEQHDRMQFEVYAFSFGPEKQDVWRARAVKAFDHFIDVRLLSDMEVVKVAKDLEIDIAIDLKGFTQDARTDIFTHRVAPIQVNYLGYPGTMGCEFIDYIIADTTLIPQQSQQFYSEKVIYLPGCYQANSSEREISDKAFAREDVGLPNEGFIFCCFNNSYKITPSIFSCWMNILKQVEGSVLWLFKSNESAEVNLRKEAELRGVEGSRLVFAGVLPVEAHLKRIQLADLFLDTHPYNAHTTASDALRVGLPVLTLTGETFAARVATSLLTAINMTEMIVTSYDEYATLAVELAKNADKMKKIQQALVANTAVSSLFDSKCFVKHLEVAYKEMNEQQR